MRSKNVYTERIDCLLTTSLNEHTLLKARPGGYFRLVWVAIYNPDASNTVSGYLGIRRRGKRFHIGSTGTIETESVKVFDDDFFLTLGDELFVNLKTSSGTITAEVTINACHFRDG